MSRPPLSADLHSYRAPPICPAKLVILIVVDVLCFSDSFLFLPHPMSRQQTTDYLHAGGTGVTTAVPTGADNRSYKTSYNRDGNTVPYSLTAHLQTNCDDLHRLTVT
jgi:hypothetical protein